MDTPSPITTRAITGERLGPPAASEADHFQTCPACGEVFDARDWAQAAPHIRPHGPR